MKFVLSTFLVICIIGYVSADTSGPFTDSTPLQLTELGDTWTVPKFDSNLGTLTSIQLTVNTAMTTSITVTNTAVTSSSGNARTQLAFFIDTAGGSKPFPDEDAVTINTVSTFYQSAMLTGNAAGAYSLSPGGNTVIGPLSVNQPTALVATINSISNFAFFTEAQAAGGGTLSFPISSFTSVVLTNNGGNTDTVQSTTALGGISVLYTFTAVISGDPQFIGFQSQHYQIHGIPDEHFNLISTPQYYVNSRFVYIANGVCTYNDTECFSHPGTYIDEIGIGFMKSEDVKIKLVAGSHDAGLTVYLNDQQLNAGARVHLPLTNTSYIHVRSDRRVSMVLDDFSLLVMNSDNFFNLGADLTNSGLFQAGRPKLVISTEDPAKADKLIATTYPEYEMHGLLGQTWRNIEWPHGRMYQGEATDYQVNSLFSPDFVFTQYVA